MQFVRLTIFCFILCLGKHLALAQSASAHSVRPTNRVVIFVGGQYFLNKGDVKVHLGNKQFLTAANSWNPQVGVSYEIAKGNFTITPSIFHGSQTHDLSWKFSFSNYDSEANFNNYTAAHTFKRTVAHLGALVMGGYSYKSSTKSLFAIQGKLGIGAIHAFSWQHERLFHDISYYVPNGKKERTFALTDAQAGTNDGWLRGGWEPFLSGYVGVVYSPKSASFIKDYRLGVNFNQAILFNNLSFNTTRSVYYNSLGEMDGIEIYENKFRSVGITLGIGF